MRLFTMISLEINSWCNRRCPFCPNCEYVRPEELMSRSLLEQILTELKDYSGRIELFMYNEPLLHPDLLEIIALCRSMVPKCKIMIATNGDLIKDFNTLPALYEAGLNQLLLNAYSEKRYPYLKQCLDELHWTIEDGNVYANSKKLVYCLEKKWEVINGKLGRFELSNRSGNVSTLPKVEALKSTCARPFRTIQVNWKGEVVLCCNDYHGEMIMGDANVETLNDIWQGHKFMHYRRKLQNKDRSMPLCDCCSFKGGAYKHLLEKVK